MRLGIKARIDEIHRGKLPEGYIHNCGYIYPEDWSFDKLEKHLIAHDELSNDTLNNPVVTSSRDGLMLQSEYYQQQRFEETRLGYHVVPRGYVTYRHMSDDDIFRFNVNDMADNVLVSPEYPVFTTKRTLLQPLLVYYLNTSSHFLSYCRAQKKGSTRTRLYFSNLKQFAMPIPSPAEQNKIVEILMHCDKVISLKQQFIKEKKKQKKWLMQNLLDPDSGIRLPGFEGEWEDRELGSFCNTFSGGTPRRGKNEYYSGKIKWIKSGELNSREIYDTEETISEAGLRNSSAKLVSPNTILLALYGATAGIIAVTRIEAAINQAVLAIIPEIEIDKNFLYYSLSNQMDYAIATYTQGGQPNFNAGIIRKLIIKLPDINEQFKIAQILLRTDKEINLLEDELSQWESKKKALMQLLLTGIVRVEH